MKPDSGKGLKVQTFEFPSRLSEVYEASAQALAFLRPLGLAEGELFDIRLCLEEAVINAMKYGNELDERRKVKIRIEPREQELCIEVTDEGRGFDPEHVADCTQDEGVLKGCGRGIFLMKQLMDEVRYNRRGNAVSMLKRFKAKSEDTRGQDAG